MNEAEIISGRRSTKKVWIRWFQANMAALHTPLRWQRWVSVWKQLSSQLNEFETRFYSLL